jgi:hypothetical protein
MYNATPVLVFLDSEIGEEKLDPMLCLICMIRV